MSAPRPSVPQQAGEAAVRAARPKPVVVPGAAPAAQATARVPRPRPVAQPIATAGDADVPVPAARPKPNGANAEKIEEVTQKADMVKGVLQDNLSLPWGTTCNPSLTVNVIVLYRACRGAWRSTSRYGSSQ